MTEILVKVGDKVEAEQSLITVEGDKASMEFRNSVCWHRERDQSERG
ncbi:biotin/lipoyl-containing protein [Escherichia coli]